MLSVSGLISAIIDDSIRPIEAIKEAGQRLSKCGSVLYKYFSDSEISISDFINQSLYFNSIDEFNDPFEFSLVCDQSLFLEFAMRYSQASSDPDSIFEGINAIKDAIPTYRSLDQKKRMQLTEILAAAQPKDQKSSLSVMQFKRFLDLLSKEKKLDNYAFFSDILLAQEQVGSKNQMDDLIQQGKDVFETQLRDQIKSRFQVCCLSETPSSVLMWSHYSNKHRGFVLQYDLRHLSYKKDLLPFTGQMVTLFPVEYIDKASELTEAMVRVGDAKYKNRASGDFASLLYKKNVVWSYEKEWRMLATSAVPVLEKFCKPSAIIFGVDCPQETRNRLFSIADERHISSFEMAIDRPSYSLKMCPFRQK